MEPYIVLTSSIYGNVERPVLECVAAVAQELPRHTTSDYLVLNRIDPKNDDEDDDDDSFKSFMQARPKAYYGYEGSFRVEYRDGTVGRHYKAYIPSGDFLLDIFRSYIDDDGRWLTMVAWRDISYEFDDLHRNLRPEEFASSFFAEGELEALIEAKNARDEEFWREMNELADELDREFRDEADELSLGDNNAFRKAMNELIQQEGDEIWNGMRVFWL